jgi:hypothetical protein
MDAPAWRGTGGKTLPTGVVQSAPAFVQSPIYSRSNLMLEATMRQ